MSLEYIQKTYNVPYAKQNFLVKYRGKVGLIIGASGPHLKIESCETPGEIWIVHPADDDLHYMTIHNINSLLQGIEEQSHEGTEDFKMV